MAKSTKLRVMLSSRCKDYFPTRKGGRRLSEIRKSLKADIEAAALFGKEFLEVWINEDTPPQEGTSDSWDTCLNAARNCDVFVALINGNAGWAKESGDIGICHAELLTALSEAPGKVRLVSLGDVSITKTAEGARNQRFQEFVSTQNLFHGGSVSTEAELAVRVQSAVRDCAIKLAQAGVREASRGRYHSGAALDWTRLDFSSRRTEITRVLTDAIASRNGGVSDAGQVFVTLGGKKVLFIPDSIPAALTVGPARELIGQPFLDDYKFAPLLSGKRAGPFHLIGCHKTATEAQAIKMLGFPDATIVSGPFGVFVADDIQKVQFAFIANCRDEAATRHGVQRFFEWLQQSGEVIRVGKRADSRARIVKTVAAEAC